MENVYRFYYLDQCYVLETKDITGKKEFLTFHVFDEINRILREQPLGVLWYQAERWVLDNHIILFKNESERIEFEKTFLEEIDYQEEDSISKIEDNYILKTEEDFMQDEEEEPSLFKNVGTFSYQNNVVTFKDIEQRQEFMNDLEKDFVLKRKIS